MRVRRWLILLIVLWIACPARAETSPSDAVVRRALLVGEEHYADENTADRTGAILSAEGVSDMLTQLSDEYDARVEADVGAAALLDAIEQQFADADPDDISLFYINCHGFYRSGVAWLLLSDGTTLTARELEAALRSGSGTVVVIVDACNSGGFIEEAERSFEEGFTGAFTGAGEASGFRQSKYKVICSSGLDQKSYRLGFGGSSEAGSVGTVLARCLCEGAGWDFIAGKRTAMRADADFDGMVTLSEMEVFLNQRVMWYLRQTGGRYRQNAKAYPSGDRFVLFRR